MRTENIPAPIQAQLDGINAVGKELARVQIPDHPDLPNLNQFMVVHGVVIANSKDYLKVNYSRYFYDKTSNARVNIEKASPEWVVGSQTTTPLMDASFSPVIISVDYVEEDANGNNVTRTEQEEKRVPTLPYLTFLLQNNIIDFIQMIQAYAVKFIADNINEFNN